MYITSRDEVKQKRKIIIWAFSQLMLLRIKICRYIVPKDWYLLQYPPKSFKINLNHCFLFTISSMSLFLEASNTLGVENKKWAGYKHVLCPLFHGTEIIILLLSCTCFVLNWIISYYFKCHSIYQEKIFLNSSKAIMDKACACRSLKCKNSAQKFIVQCTLAMKKSLTTCQVHEWMFSS